MSAQDQQHIDQQRIDQQRIDQQGLDQQCIDQPSIEQQPIDQQSIDKQHIEQQPIDQPFIDQQRIDQSTDEREANARLLELEARTTDLAVANEALHAARLATLNLMEDAIRAQRRAEALAKDLQEKNQELEELLYSASHDLRSPLLNVRGFSDSLSDSCGILYERLRRPDVPDAVRSDLAIILADRIPSAIHFIQAGGQKLNALIDGLMVVSRVGSREPRMGPVDMMNLVTMVRNATAFQIQQCGAEVEVEELPGCFGDAGLLNQVFTNLLDNALKYRHPNRSPRIRITGHVKECRAFYCVEDNGLGIDSRHHDRVWKLFHRLNPNGPVNGEGLGLSLVQRILQRHRGRAWLESEVGSGSRFHVELPAVAPII